MVSIGAFLGRKNSSNHMSLRPSVLLSLVKLDLPDIDLFLQSCSVTFATAEPFRPLIGLWYEMRVENTSIR
jgi:hypothetical protein